MNNEFNNIKSASTKVVIKNNYSRKKNGKSIVSLVFGIISLVFFWSFIFPIIAGFLGIIIGIISLIKKYDSVKLSICGIVTSILGFLLSLLTNFSYILMYLS
ncbi:hypothetical protein BGI42_15935 [Clostridium taeniosporum]|uniref:DUF4190 domain-containing protein n=1 Tax=Clostridium taeniosporum TaxID=394958 RepID=A0A2I6SDG3_9CLOT|nr:hypothetical protein BGI42_15935 [Clostridium taeniosporum]